MQNENETGLQVGEFVQSELFGWGRTVETAAERKVVIGYRDEFDVERVDAIYKVVSVTQRPPGFSGGFRGDLVVARRMISWTEEGDEVIEFVYGGKGRRSISSVDVVSHQE